MGSAPRGLTGHVEYVVELYTSSPSTFGPQTKFAEIWDSRNIGWSRYDRIPGKAFFSLPQSSTYITYLTPLLTHVRITRVTPTVDTLLWQGVYIEPNSTGDDVIFDCFDYLSLLSLSRSGFKTLYPSKKIGTEVAAAEWGFAKGATSSPLNFVATGTIEDPRDVGDTVDLTTSAEFGTLDQNRLQLLFDLTEMGRANTGHWVTYEITLSDTPTFNFWKDKGSLTTTGLVLNGNVSDYQHLPGWTRYRNDLATVATSDLGGAEEIVATEPTGITNLGLRQDVTTLRTLIGVSGSTVLADQQKQALEYQLIKASQRRPAVALRMERGTLAPFDGWNIADRVYTEIDNGLDLIRTTPRIVGVRAMYREFGEDITVVIDQDYADEGWGVPL